MRPCLRHLTKPVQRIISNNNPCFGHRLYSKSKKLQNNNENINNPSSECQIDKFPIIDISSFLSSTKSNRTRHNHQTLVNELIDVSSNVGFFYITGFNDIVPQSLISNTFSQLRLFFDLPLEEKLKIHVNTTPYLRGYMSPGDQGYYGLDDTDKRHDIHYNDSEKLQKDLEQKEIITDMKEVFTMGTELALTHKNFHQLLFGPNIFPLSAVLPDFERVIKEYYNSVLALSNELYQLFAISLNMDCAYFDDKIKEGMNSMNCIYYMSLPEDKRVSVNQFGIGEHTDYECFTLLLQDEESPSGLEVLMDNGEWKRYEPIKNTFVVNFGDIMARWSNDMFRSTVHRAVNDVYRERYSIAFFRHCDFDIKVTNLKCDETAKYKDVIAGQHMLERVERANQPIL